MAGYSGTPLVKKLGLSPEARKTVLHAPTHYNLLLTDFFPSMATALTQQQDWIHAFYIDKHTYAKELPRLKECLSVTGQLWISWPKKSSKVPTTLDENIVRSLGLAIGLVDVKVAAIDEIWSGLKFVYRLNDR